MYNTLLGIPFSSILCTCPNQHKLFNLTVSAIMGFFNHYINSLLVNIPRHKLGLKFFYTLSFKKCWIACYLSLFVSRFLMHTF
jgi:hypothetical protein